MKKFDQYLNQAIANGIVQVLDELWQPAEQQLEQRMEQDSKELPTPAEELAEAWRHAHKRFINGRICSLGHMRERRVIITEAEEMGVLEEFTTLIHGGA